MTDSTLDSPVEALPSLSSPEVVAMEEAMMATWPSHTEGSGGTGDFTYSSYWQVIDPAVPSRTLAAHLIAALRERGIRLDAARQPDPGLDVAIKAVLDWADTVNRDALEMDYWPGDEFTALRAAAYGSQPDREPPWTDDILNYPDGRQPDPAAPDPLRGLASEIAKDWNGRPDPTPVIEAAKRLLVASEYALGNAGTAGRVGGVASLRTAADSLRAVLPPGGPE